MQLVGNISPIFRASFCYNFPELRIFLYEGSITCGVHVFLMRQIQVNYIKLEQLYKAIQFKIKIVLQHYSFSILPSFKYIMSFKANLSIFLHLNSFTNIALPHKARYALTAQLYQTTNNQPNTALPFNILQTSRKIKKNVGRESAIDNNYFRSKKFNIEFQDEQIELNDCCEFKMSIECFPTLNTDNIYLEFALVENHICYFREDIEEEVELKEVEKYRFKLENIESGIFKYNQGQFCKSYISKFSFTIFLMITDYRFHPYMSTKPAESNKQKERQNIESLKQLMKWGQKYVKECPNPQEIFYTRYVKNLLYNSFCFRAQINQALKVPEELQLMTPIGQNRQLLQTNQKDFFHFVTNDFPEVLTEDLIRQDIHRINANNFYFIQKFTKYIIDQLFNQQTLLDNYRRQKNDLFGERLMRSIVFGKQPHDKEKNAKMASKIRKKKTMHEQQIIDQHLFVKKQNQHYAFLEVNLPHSLKTKEYEENSFEHVLRQISELRKGEVQYKPQFHERNMVVIFCHGFQASSYDMQMLKRQISKMLPVAFTYSSTANEMNTENDISILGMKLADEIQLFLKRNFQDPADAILNFVGHSMGGIIARASLAHLQKNNYQFGFYFSLSTPHLGYLNGVDTMIRAGLWFMRKMNKIQSLDQLVMQDSQVLRQTFLFKLSQIGNLRSFKKIILLSSSEDSYVPWHSARMCYNSENNSRTRLQKEMINNILGDQIVHRIDIHFNINSTKDLDSFIGRAAHIHLLTQECIMKLINQSIPNLFDIQVL